MIREKMTGLNCQYFGGCYWDGSGSTLHRRELCDECFIKHSWLSDPRDKPLVLGIEVECFDGEFADEIEEMEVDLEYYKTKTEEKRRHIDRLTDRMGELRAQIARLEADNAALKAQVRGLQAERELLNCGIDGKALADHIEKYNANLEDGEVSITEIEYRTVIVEKFVLGGS